MVRTRLPFRKINDSSDLVDRLDNLNIKKNMKKNNGRIPLSPIFEIRKNVELAAKREAEKLAKKVADYSKGSRPAIPLMLYECVKDVAEVMNRPGHREDDSDLKEAEYTIFVGCRIFNPLLPVGWKYQRENASSLIAGYEKVFEMDDEIFIM